MAVELTSRGNASATMPEEVAATILTGSIQQSAALQLFRKVPMSRLQARIPVISALPTAKWITGDTGMKPTSHAEWKNKFLNAEEVAVICPIPEAVLDDAGYPLWDTIRPLCEESIGRALDAAIFFGTNKPASWPTALAAAAIAAGNYVRRGTASQATGGVAKDISDVMGTVESDGFDVNGFVAARVFRSILRGARDTTGQKLLDVGTQEIEGSPIKYAMDGMWGSAQDDPEMFMGDFSQGIIGVRQDISWKLLSEAVLQNDDGTIAYNLAQQDMVALRLTARFAFEVPNPINRAQTVEANRFPFGVLRHP